MNIDYITLLIIGSISSVVIFLCLAIAQQVYKNRIFKKIKNKPGIRLVIKLIEIIFVIGTCLFLILIPEIDILFNNKIQLISVFYLLIILLSGIFFDIWLSVLSAFPFLIFFIIYQSVTKTNSSNFLLLTIYQIIFLFLALGFCTINNISKRKTNNFYQILVSICLIAIYMIITVIFFHSNEVLLKQMVLQIAIIWLIYIVVFIIYNWYSLLNNKIKSISSNQLYDNKYFLNSVIANQTIYDYIQTNNIQYGLVILFSLINFNKPNNNYDNSGNKYIKQQILKEIVENMKPLKPIFFMTEDNQYACFIELVDIQENLSTIYYGNNRTIRIEKDFINNIQNCIYHIPKTVLYQNKKQQINSCAYGAIYGIHSSNLKQLINMCVRTKQDSYLKFRNSTLVIFDPKVVNTKKWSTKNYNNYNDDFLINQFFIKLEINDTLFNENCYIANVNYLPKMLLTLEDIKQYANQKNILEHTLRMIAMQIIKEYNNIKNKNVSLVVDYSLSYVTSEYFNLEDLVNKLSSLNVDNKQLIFKFDLDESKNNTNFINVAILQKQGIKIWITNATIQNLDVLKQIQPNYITFKTKINNKLTLQNIKSILQKINIQLINN